MYRLFAFLLLSLTTVAVAQEKPEQAARKPAEAWLTLVDEGKYDESWDQAASAFKAQLTKEQWSQQIGQVRQQTGKLKSRALKSANYSESIPNAPPGKYVLFQLQSTYENGVFTEMVASTLDKDGSWRVVGYFVRPPGN